MNVIFALCFLCAMPTVAPVPATAPKDMSTHGTDKRIHSSSSTMTKPSKPELPTMALIGFLGDYADAGDGLDPISLAEHPDIKLDPDKVEHKP